MESKAQIVDSILETVRKEMSEFIEEEPGIKCPIKYEKRVWELALSYARNVIEGAQGEVPKSRNAKKKS